MGFLANNCRNIQHWSYGNYWSFDDMLNVAKQILTTRGVNSKVLDNGIGKDVIAVTTANGNINVKPGVQQYKTIGHIGLFDFDGLSKQFILNECMDLDGINILWASSKTGFHLWNLSIRSVEEVALIGLQLHSDCKHVAHGYCMGKWVLRIAPKFRENESRYKPAPKLVCTWANDTLRNQSKAHFSLFIALTGKTILHANSYDFGGIAAAEIEDYRTLTDKMKAGLCKK